FPCRGFLRRPCTSHGTGYAAERSLAERRLASMNDPLIAISPGAPTRVSKWQMATVRTGRPRQAGATDAVARSWNPSRGGRPAAVIQRGLACDAAFPLIEADTPTFRSRSACV